MVHFYICHVCGNIIEKIVDGGNTPSCCNRVMSELVAGSTDGAVETHVPVYSTETLESREHCEGDSISLDIKCSSNMVTVQIGSKPHPMDDRHHIQFILLETTTGVHRHDLKPTDEPKASFFLQPGEQVVCVYCYCNLHGLFKMQAL